MKSVAVLGVFVLLMAGAAIYSSNQRAFADTKVDFEPECRVYFDPELSEVKAGDIFSVYVLVDDVKDLWGYEIGLKFDRSVIEYVGAKTPFWRFVSGRIEYIFWVAGVQPQNGRVELMEFAFKAKSEGSSSLGYYIHNLATIEYLEAASDYVGWPIPHMVSEGLVTVS